MANWNDDNEDKGGGLNEVQQMQMDAIILETAYNNAWMLLTGEITFDELMTSQFSEGRDYTRGIGNDITALSINDFKSVFWYSLAGT